MNIFVPQSIETQIELEEIADVKKQIMTSTTSGTIIGIVQDGLVGAYNLTAPNMLIDWRTAMNLISYTTIKDYIKFEKNKNYTGHELFSFIIPDVININKGEVKIKSGQLLKGRLSKDMLGSKKKNTIHQAIWNELGADPTNEFINNTQKITNNFNTYRGFTVGYGDISFIDSLRPQFKTIFDTVELKVHHMIAEIENNPDLMESSVFEFKLFSELNIIRDNIAKIIVLNMSIDNNINIMDKAGSKGGPTNTGQMGGSMGLQAVEGKLIAKKYNNRTLAYFHQNDDRPRSRGFVKQSLFDGIDFPGFTYILMAAREGLIDTAIKTASTGYAQRRIVKSMEDIIVKYDGTVRTANNTVVQMIYGDSGADTTKQFEYVAKIMEQNNKEIETKHKFTIDELKQLKNKNYDTKINDYIYNLIIDMRDLLRRNIFKAKANYKTLDNVFMLPVSISRIVDNSLNNNKIDNKDVVDPKYVLEQLNNVLNNKMTKLMCMTLKEQEDNKSLKYKTEQASKTVLRVALYEILSPKRCVLEYKFSKEQFDNIIKTIIYNYNKNIVQPGENVGIIGAQSMGEPITQMTISTFHSSGIGSMSITTQGVPRALELLSVTKKIKTPQLSIYLTEEYKTNKEMAHKIASYIKYTSLGDIRGNIQVYFDPIVGDVETNSIMQQDNVKYTFYNQKVGKKACNGDINNLPWLMRIEILKERMIEKEVSLLEIKSKFCNWWEKRFNDTKSMKKEEKKVINKITSIAVLSNSDGDEQPVIHIRFNVKDVDKINDPFNKETLNDFIDHVIDKFKLKGLSGIKDIPLIMEERQVTINKETGDVGNQNQQVIFTAGVNLIDIRYIIGVDVLNTICNDVAEVYNVFGIEIARNRLLREIASVYENAGQQVNYQNLSLLVDNMTNNGTIISVDRHGMNKTDTDPLARASFEKSVEQLTRAAVFGETDHMRSVSSRIMAGLVIKSGTGFCDVILDTEKIEQSEQFDIDDDDDNIGYSKYKEILTENIATDIINKDTEMEDIFNPEL